MQRKQFLYFVCVLPLTVRILTLNIPKATYAAFYTKRAETELQWGQPSKAIQSLRKAIYHNPQYRQAHLDLALINDSQQNPEALNHLLKIISLGPEYEKIYLNLQSSDVIKDYPYAYSCYKIGLDYLEKDNLDQALGYLKRAVLFDGSLVDARYHLALVYLKINDIPRAIEQTNALQDMQIYPPSKKIREQIPNIEEYEHLIR